MWVYVFNCLLVTRKILDKLTPIKSQRQHTIWFICFLKKILFFVRIEKDIKVGVENLSKINYCYLKCKHFNWKIHRNTKDPGKKCANTFSFCAFLLNTVYVFIFMVNLEYSIISHLPLYYTSNFVLCLFQCNTTSNDFHLLSKKETLINLHWLKYRLILLVIKEKGGQMFNTEN